MRQVTEAAALVAFSKSYVDVPQVKKGMKINFYVVDRRIQMAMPTYRPQICFSGCLVNQLNDFNNSVHYKQLLRWLVKKATVFVNNVCWGSFREKVTSQVSTRHQLDRL